MSGMKNLTDEELQEKWEPVLFNEAWADIKDPHKRRVCAQLLENTQNDISTARFNSEYVCLSETASLTPVNQMGASSSTQGTGGIDIFDPVLISLVRRSMPNLVAYDICGVQPMTGPTGLIFAMRSHYANATVGMSNTTGGYGVGNVDNEAFYLEPNTQFSAAMTTYANTFGNAQVGTIPGGTNTSPLQYANQYNTGWAMTTASSEALGVDSGTAIPQMAFSIEKVTVTANTRALMASYTMELAQDLKAVHGLDAETELTNILAAEILAEINREVLRTINFVASLGAQTGTTTAGVFDLDTDSNGRWSVEKFKGMHFQLEREANALAKATRRGKGNILICSSDVASALQMTGTLDVAGLNSQLNSNKLEVDDTGNTFAGVLNGRIKVYIDPYSAGGNYFTMGYKGASAFDAGMFYCPYIPLQSVRAVDQSTFQPKVAFKTRYGMVANPFAEGQFRGLGRTNQINSNVYYRKVIVNNIM